MPIVPIFGNASATSAAAAWYGLDGRAQVTCVAGPAHIGFYGLAQAVCQTGSPKIDVEFRVYSEPANAKLATFSPTVNVIAELYAEPASCSLGVRRGADCGGPYGCLSTEDGNPKLELPAILQTQPAAAKIDCSASLGVLRAAYSDRPASCLLALQTTADIGVFRACSGAAQIALSCTDVPTRSGDISGLVVQEIRLEALPAAVKCITYVCVSNFVVTGPPTGDWLVLVDDPSTKDYTAIGPAANVFNTAI